MKRYITIGLTLCCCILLSAQDKKPWPLRVLHSIKTYIDSSAVRGIDPNYIKVPEKPWAVMLRYKANDMDLRSTSTIDHEMMAEKGLYGELNWESAFKPSSEVSIGAWIGYRGYGLGYSYSLHRSDGRNFSFGATGANYGLNLRIRRFHTNEIEARMWGYDESGPFDEPFEETETWDDIKVKTAIFDGFYMFNGKRFSYAAAYDQSSIQIRSAGSFMLGLMWFQTSIDYARPLNALLIQILDGVGRIKLHEGSIGLGYAYNWVPMKNLLINITAMPMLVVYNRTKAYLYESNYDIFLGEGEVSPTGKKYVPDDDDSWQDDITLEEVSSTTKYGKLSLNIDARASITYNFDRFFLNVYGQVNHWHNKVDNNRIKLTDWYVNASLGFRF